MVLIVSKVGVDCNAVHDVVTVVVVDVEHSLQWNVFRNYKSSRKFFVGVSLAAQ